MAPREPLEAHFAHFWAWLLKWLPGNLWRSPVNGTGHSQLPFDPLFGPFGDTSFLHLQGAFVIGEVVSTFHKQATASH